MLILFDNGTPRTLSRYLIDHHAVTEARARGWEGLDNGELLNEAEAAGFEVLVTTGNDRRQQACSVPSRRRKNVPFEDRRR